MSKLARSASFVVVGLAGCVYGTFSDVDFRGYACASDDECPGDLVCVADICNDPFVVEGEGDVGEGEGDVVGEGEGDVVGEGEGDVVGEGEGDIVGEGEGEVVVDFCGSGFVPDDARPTCTASGAPLAAGVCGQLPGIGQDYVCDAADRMTVCTNGCTDGVCDPIPSMLFDVRPTPSSGSVIVDADEVLTLHLLDGDTVIATLGPLGAEQALDTCASVGLTTLDVGGRTAVVLNVDELIINGGGVVTVVDDTSDGSCGGFAVVARVVYADVDSRIDLAGNGAEAGCGGFDGGTTFGGVRLAGVGSGGGHATGGAGPNGGAPFGGPDVIPFAGGGGGGDAALGAGGGGGGALYLYAVGAAVLNGTIDVSGAQSANGGGAGGSVVVEAGSIAGDGVIDIDDGLRSPENYAEGLGRVRLSAATGGTNTFAGTVIPAGRAIVQGTLEECPAVFAQNFAAGRRSPVAQHASAGTRDATLCFECVDIDTLGFLTDVRVATGDFGAVFAGNVNGTDGTLIFIDGASRFVGTATATSDAVGFDDNSAAPLIVVGDGPVVRVFNTDFTPFATIAGTGRLPNTPVAVADREAIFVTAVGVASENVDDQGRGELVSVDVTATIVALDGRRDLVAVAVATATADRTPDARRGAFAFRRAGGAWAENGAVDNFRASPVAIDLSDSRAAVGVPDDDACGVDAGGVVIGGGLPIGELGFATIVNAEAPRAAGHSGRGVSTLNGFVAVVSDDGVTVFDANSVPVLIVDGSVQAAALVNFGGELALFGVNGQGAFFYLPVL